MKKLFLPFLFLLGVFALCTGCSSGVDRIGLQVHVIKLERKADGSFLATLRFSNPNVGAINVGKSTHQLSLNGKPAGVLEVTEPIGLPAQQAVTTTVSFRPVGGSTGLAGEISYQLVSSLTLRIYDNSIEHFKSSSAGTVTVL